MTLAEAAVIAAELGRPVKPVTLRVWCEKGFMTCRKIGGGRGALWLVTRAALEHALATVPRKGEHLRRWRRGGRVDDATETRPSSGGGTWDAE